MPSNITADEIRRRIAAGTNRVAPQDLTIRGGRIVPVNGPGGARVAGRAVGATVPFDPALSAFMRQMGAEEAAIRAQARQEVESAQAQWNLSAPMWDQRIEDATNAVAMDAEERGLYRSGATVTGIARGRAGIEGERAAAAAALRDQAMASQRAAQDRVLGLRREAAEQELAARTRIGQRRAETTYGAR